MFAYDRQAICDPAQTPYYFDCLQSISDHRQSEDLQVKVATLQSQGMVSQRDLRAAYRFLDVNPGDTDDHIANKFSVRQSNSGSQAQEAGREALQKIGMARASQRLIRAAKQELETYEDALRWLDAQKDTDDSFIETLVTVKLGDNPSDADSEIAKKAISIIAKERKSSTLEALLAGETRSEESAMSADEALRHLNITDDFKSVDQAVWPTLFEVARADRPGPQTERAIAAIEKELSEFSSRPPELWPVGLTSHGNTCYLNSLLQYYFCIKPLREIVLDYGRYKLDTATHSAKAERVGGRILTPVEIQGGQRFGDDLKYLFERMIKDRQPHIKPEPDLVCRAFLPLDEYALLDSEARPETQNPKPNGDDTAMKDDGNSSDMNVAAQADAEETTQQSDASSVTLVGDEDVVMKDNDSPSTPPASPSQKPVNDQAEPSKPPPLPPRRFSTVKEDALLKAQRNARQQQDVAEVLENAMFRLRSGIVSRGMDDEANGAEQQDELRDIFEISIKVNTVQEDGSEKAGAVYEANSSIMTFVPTESTDVYAMLDKVFDLQDVATSEGNSKKAAYRTIEKAPPLLQISIPRNGDYDVRRGGASKSEELVILHDELYLDRYMADSDVMPLRRKCWGWRKHLRSLKEERVSLSKTVMEADGPTALAESAKFLNELGDISNELEDLGIEGIDVEPDLPSDLLSTAEQAQARINELQQRSDELQAKFNQVFADLKQVKYELAVVFIHRGGLSTGHYWPYIRDFKQNCWREYNDEKVTELSNDKFHEVTRRTGQWKDGTPTYAVYVRESDKTAYIDPVCRDPEPEKVIPEINFPSEPPREASEGSKAATVTEGGQGIWDEARQVPEAVAW
jgi:ubiquitin carboxyl-terminal hydrolase 25/28